MSPKEEWIANYDLVFDALSEVIDTDNCIKLATIYANDSAGSLVGVEIDHAEYLLEDRPKNKVPPFVR
jgi:hypothetical protein